MSTRLSRSAVARLCAMALAVSAMQAASLSAAQPRPYIFGTGHFLARWAGQPWSYDLQAMDKMVEMGATAVWVDFPWAAMEATPGVYDFAYADHQIDAAEARGLQMFAFVGTTPEWARAFTNLPPHRTPPAEQYLPAFNAFHTALAARYAGRVTYYQFWNEPSGCGWVNNGCSNGSDCTLFTLWQKRAYDALKLGNPDCVVSAGGFDGNPANYVQCMYSNGGGAGFDAISIHPYASGGNGGPGTSGEAIDYSDLTEVRGVMVNNGDAHKKIWITEYGWNTTDEPRRAADQLELLTELKKPEYDYLFFAKNLVLNDWDDADPARDFCCYGLTSADFTPKPAYFTFRDFDKAFPDNVDFAADVTVGTAPLAVNFTDLSGVAGASAWHWAFGDGATSDQQHPSHIYLLDGTYTVSLTVTGDAGPIILERIDYIRVGVITAIVNPSFEDPFGFLNGWSSCLAGGSSIKHNPSTHTSVPRFHDGDNSAGMSSARVGNDLGAGAIWQQVAVVPGRTYRVSCWGYITTEGSEYLDDVMELRVRDGDDSPLTCAGNGAAITASSTLLAHQPGTPGAWHELAGEVTPTQPVITVIAYWKFAGTVWVINSMHLDDFVIVPVDEPLELLSAAARKTHDTAGPFDVDLPLTGEGVEGRLGGPEQVVMTFSDTFAAIDGTLDCSEVTLSAGSCAGVAAAGADLVIDVADLPPTGCITVTVAGIASGGGGLASPAEVSWRLLPGDHGGDGTVNIVDLNGVKTSLFQPVDAGTFRADINADGVINIVDLNDVKSRLFNTASCP